MSSEQEAEEDPDGNSVCAARPGTISPSQTEDVNEDKDDGSNVPTSQNQTQDVHEDAEDASDAKLLVNDDKAEGSNTVRDA